MVKEVVEPMLDEGQPKEKLQEPYCYGERNGMVEDEESVSCPEVGALAALI
jgi:hypothetical protein